MEDHIKLNGNGTNCKENRAKTELEEFDALFPELVKDLTNIGLKDAEISDAIDWFKEVIEYNVPFGKKNRGIAVVTSYCQLVTNPTDDDIKRARILGWCIEIFQAFSLIVDDMMDSSITRRGKSCWYKKQNVGMRAINDSNFLESALYFLLKKYFRDQPCYKDLLELFHDITHHTVIGECLDLVTSRPQSTVDLSSFTLDRYNTIVRWKTAFYSFYLPVAMGMYMAGVSDTDAHSKAKSILLKMGYFFQVQDDYLDCYGSPEVIGKIGTDIQDNKCSWLIVQAMMKGTPEQRKILEDNYGRDDESKIKRVKELYRDLNLTHVYTEYEESSYKELKTLIEKCSGNLPKEVFMAFARKIYKRQK
ncbi:hypothetical protein SNE40_003008 [Patella caerulea]|uniref:Farnesyl pyrophosphate synthase n=1 Tax=Patella caerulea TaxID=87958 RepID=A0AAN8K9P2_PATCE